MSVNRSAAVGPPKSPGRLTEKPESVDRNRQGGRVPSHQTSQTLRPCPNSCPTTPFRLSAVLQATLRPTSDNSPPYFDASKAESPIKQGGESRHIRRRVSPSRAVRVSTRGRRQCRRAGWGHLGGPTRPGRQAGLVQVSAPTPTLSAGRPLPYRRADFPKPACRECQGSRMIVRRGSRDSYG